MKRRALVFFLLGTCNLTWGIQPEASPSRGGGGKLEEPNPSPSWSTLDISAMKGCMTPFPLPYKGQRRNLAIIKRKAQQGWVVGDLAAIGTQ